MLNKIKHIINSCKKNGSFIISGTDKSFDKTISLMESKNIIEFIDDDEIILIDSARPH